MSLHLAFCSHAAATFACTAWHYSRAMPASRRVCIGVWEDGAFVGVVIFSRGAVYHIGTSFGLPQSACCELTRIALRDHAVPVSRIVRIAITLVTRQSPGLRLIVSYADPAHGHRGGIYQAGNWLYAGLTRPECLLRVHGRLVHPRTIGSRYGTRHLRWLQEHVDASAEKAGTVPKHKYLYPLDAAMRAQVKLLRQPYPTRPKDQAPTLYPVGLDGETPIRPLQFDEAAHG